MPHMNQIHLPRGLTKCNMYFMMKDQLLGQGLTTVVSLLFNLEYSYIVSSRKLS